MLANRLQVQILGHYTPVEFRSWRKRPESLVLRTEPTEVHPTLMIIRTAMDTATDTATATMDRKLIRRRKTGHSSPMTRMLDRQEDIATRPIPCYQLTMLSTKFFNTLPNQ